MKAIVLFFSLILLSACTMTPRYHRPPMAIPNHYKEAGKWIPAQPTYAEHHRGPWWEVYGDPVLNGLENRVRLANQDLKAALARYEEARAALTIARSYYYPTGTGVTNISRQQISGNVANKEKRSLFSDVVVGANMTYEVDVFGRVRSAVAQSQHLALASRADLGAIDLSLHAELASDYFSLRAADEKQRVLDNLVIAYQKALNLVRALHSGGAAPIADVDQAETQLENA